MRYARERLVDIREEIEPLMARHYAELGQQDLVFDPDWARALAFDAAGILIAYTARLDSGALVGYAGYFVQPHLHYRRDITAVNDVVWIAPECRGGVGMRMLRFAELGLAALGAVKVYYHAKLDHPALARVLTHLGYEAQEMIYARRIG